MIDDFYRALEERFRASREDIRARLEGYRPFLSALCQTTPRPKAFDIGCGRGEWLELLTEVGLDARGVDLDDSMLAACHERGLHAQNQDALEALQALPDASLDLISAFHVVEHLTFDYLRALLKEAQRTLSPHGLLILETPNAENLIVGTNNFYLDPTHQRPVPAIFLEFLCQHSGFVQSKIVRLQEDQALHTPDAYIGLWQVLYGVSPDYAIVARKSVPAEPANDAFAQLFSKDYGLDLQTLAQRHDQYALRNNDAQHAVNQRLESLGNQLHTQGEYAEQLAQLCKESAERAEAAEAELRLIYSSRSWQITRPMRELFDTLRHMDRASLKRGLARSVIRPVFGTLNYVNSKPRLAQALRAAVNRVPGLKGQMRGLAFRLGRLSQPVLSDVLSSYSPRVVQLGQHLQHLLEPEAKASATPQLNERPRLAYVSPMPPDRTGIADYSAELLPALAQYYEIDVIVEQGSATPNGSGYQLRDPDWLLHNAHSYSAVLYHFGNSPFHCYMVELIEQVPGIVVLHDFYLSGLIWAMETRPAYSGIKMRELYYSHGYSALIEAQHDERKIAERYSFNRSVLQRAQGVIVHSAVSLRLAEQSYGAQACADWVQIPLLRELADQSDKAHFRAHSREALKITEGAFIVCSFGLLGETKLNDRLLDAWLASDLADDSDCHLVFVGDLGTDDYAQTLRKRLADVGAQSRISITGWADSATFEHYLGAADIAVQLRSLTRGETSAAVLDCMNHGVATIVNANGSMADLPETGVYRLPDTFSDVQLAEALQLLRHDPQARSALGQRGREVIEQHHTPQHCAGLYHLAIERFCQRNLEVEQGLRQVLAQLPIPVRETNEVLAQAEQLLQGRIDPLRPRQLLLDITGTFIVDRHSGIERVAKALTVALLNQPPAGVRVEPVYLSNLGGHWHYRYANAFTAKLLDLPFALVDRGIDYGPGDQLIALDLSGNSLVQASLCGLYKRLQAVGVNCRVLVHDLLPVSCPELFPPQADHHFADWLNHVARLDGAVCVTNTVAGELRQWMHKALPDRVAHFTFDHSHHGADLSNSSPSQGLPSEANELMAMFAMRPSVLMVGTLEPRKGYLQAVDAFTQLWESGVDVNLVIVGRAGWQQLPLDQQRSIPQLLARLANHPEKGRRLFWLDGPSDEFLELIYASASGLLAASEDEGFGLPLIEAAQKGLPILARDIPVFREVATQHACYFTADDPRQLAAAVSSWVEKGFQPSSIDMPWLTWQQSADNLQHLLLDSPATAL
ncbi:glycosyltransferase [Pseudomonas sp. CCI3.2]|uniref:glycosyltransferase n=1 Tax=unclassified Pseudomonas TaxID=196821 RepID=UPI002AC95B6E|nr:MULTISPECIES: glycosyltransferase [unclassified Pseudomonas]MEB0075950.1 glycosyltransferase [Pseudomonas sp. MH10out]MEB0101395.1 glycosyltransferase [Pseudomonas sp. CCI3.2]MEB0130929.1 glycosyltransferase [Pseudomonas sp. CCI2.4]MEB0157907.1 glycosyltransferase [Pseudomonas sp. AH2 (2023)]MEB0166388.1 glycosyltransferase [Pseudomonas sp. CCC4.4]